MLATALVGFVLEPVRAVSVYEWMKSRSSSTEKISIVRVAMGEFEIGPP